MAEKRPLTRNGSTGQIEELQAGDTLPIASHNHDGDYADIDHNHDTSYQKKSELGYSDNLIPTMTSNSAPSPVVVSADSEYDANYAAWKAGNKSNSDCWGSGVHGTPWWWKVDLGALYYVSKYTVTNTTTNTSTPTSWILEGSTDNSNWTTLDTQTDVTWATASLTKTFFIDGSNAYRYFRTTISKVDGSTGATVAAWAEVGLFVIKAFDSDKLDGQHASEFAVADHTQTIDKGGTGQTTAQAAIDALTAVSGADEGDVLTVDADGHAVFAAPAGGSGSGIFDCGTPTAYTTGTPLIDCGGI